MATSTPSTLENRQDEICSSSESELKGRQRIYTIYTNGAPTYRRAPRAGAIITSARLSRRR